MPMKHDYLTCGIYYQVSCPACQKVWLHPRSWWLAQPTIESVVAILPDIVPDEDVAIQSVEDAAWEEAEKEKAESENAKWSPSDLFAEEKL